MAIGSSLGTRFWCSGSGERTLNGRPSTLESTATMHRPRFYIVQYFKLTAIAAIVLAVVVSWSPENGGLFLGLFLLIGLAPVYLQLLPKSPETVLLHLPEHPDEQIAVLERVIARPVLFRSGPKRAVRVKLMQLYAEGRRLKEAVNLGREILIQFRLSQSLESLIRLEMAICLNGIDRDTEARTQMQIVRQRVADPPVDALGWLVKGRVFDADHFSYALAIGSYGTHAFPENAIF